LHRALSDEPDAPPWPLALRVAHYAEAFTLAPSEVLRELRRLPVGFLDEVIEARAYARAKGELARADAMKPRPELTPQMSEVEAIEFELVQEDRARRDG
jgi:hypothetical protein